MWHLVHRRRSNRRSFLSGGSRTRRRLFMHANVASLVQSFCHAAVNVKAVANGLVAQEATSGMTTAPHASGGAPSCKVNGHSFPFLHQHANVFTRPLTPMLLLKAAPQQLPPQSPTHPPALRLLLTSRLTGEWRLPFKPSRVAGNTHLVITHVASIAQSRHRPASFHSTRQLIHKLHRRPATILSHV